MAVTDLYNIMPSCHFSMLKDLGADLSLNTPTFQTSFPHPFDTSICVNILLDACHNVKLVRNTLADRGVLFDAEGGRISWGFNESLNTLQEEEGLRLGNRLKKSHIQWRKQKMKVNLAAQALSASVADALEYSDTVLALPQFSDSATTVKFLRIFDELFDVLNSRNPFGTGFKAPMCKTNRDRWQRALDTADKYIRQLKDTDGRQVTEGKWRTGFVGFCVCLHSVKAIFDTLVAFDDPPMQYLITSSVRTTLNFSFLQFVLEVATTITLLCYSSRQPINVCSCDTASKRLETASSKTAHTY